MFLNFVDRVLFHSDVSSVQKFRLLYYGSRLDSVYSWIFTALERRVQELDLNFLMLHGDIELPPMFFSSKTLVVVKLWHAISLDIPSTVWLPSLKILHLRSVEYSNHDSIQKLLSGCLILEELLIEREEEDNQLVLNVSVPALKILNRFVVDAPNLEYFTITDYVSKEHLVNNISSLIKAFIDIGPDSEEFEESSHNGHMSYRGRISELLRRISNVKYLSLTGGTLDGYTNELIPEGWMIPHQVPFCLVLHLKEIEIRNIVGENHEIKAVEYLLRHVEVLKKMTIYCHETSLGKEFCACKKLFGFSKGSTSCKLTVFCSC
ncbi:hypothetical protein PVL29_026165 [Vitis rotundifolia]|uniref:FBD domain-containing protein n=1 Tax=Vitis rotundifolia TaxID=103349 RepID=A0AA39D878_VITRO|nr:hypothetical protein PVL29_026165 [Vitis rotundifolia]